MTNFNPQITAAIKAFKSLQVPESTLAKNHIFITDTDLEDIHEKAILNELKLQHDNLLKYPWHLPFEICSLIYNDGSTIIFMPGKDSNTWTFIVRDNFETNYPRSLQGTFSISESKELITNPFMLEKCYPSITPLGPTTKEGLWLILQLGFLLYKGEIYSVKDNINTDLFKHITELQEIFMHGISLIAKFSTEPKFFVVETHNITKRKKRTLISDKAYYKILHITNIRKNYIKSSEHTSETSRSSYERRAHLRTYKHPRYINVQGTTVLIKTTWVGPTEVIKENILYKIRIDLH